MACDSGCGTKCTTADAANLTVSNIIITPSQTPNPGDQVTVTADITNGFPVNLPAVRLCVYDDDTGQCIASTGTAPIVQFMTSTFGPITLGKMPSRVWNLQIAAKQTTIPYVKYDCGPWTNIQLTPYYPSGQLCECTSAGCVQGVVGANLDCNVCATTCTAPPGGITCSATSPCPSGNMCVLGLCIPSPVIFIGLLYVLYTASKG